MENLVKNANQNSYAQPKSWALGDPEAPTGTLDIEGLRTKEDKKRILKEYKDDVAFWNSPVGQHIRELNQVVEYAILRSALTIEIDYLVEADPMLLDKDDPEAMEFIQHTAKMMGSWESCYSFWKSKLEEELKSGRTIK